MLHDIRMFCGSLHVSIRAMNRKLRRENLARVQKAIEELKREPFKKKKGWEQKGEVRYRDVLCDDT